MVNGAIFGLVFPIIRPPWKIFCRHSWQYVLKFQSNHAQRHRKGDKWRHALQGAGLGGASTHFIQTFKNEFFNRNLGQNIPKNAYFLEKKAVKLPQRPAAPLPNPRWTPAAGDFRSLTPALLLLFTDIDLSKYVFSVNLFY